MPVNIAVDAPGAWPRGTRVRKTVREDSDLHDVGAMATVIGSMGPASIGDREDCYAYFVAWDDMPDAPCVVADYRIEPVDLYDVILRVVRRSICQCGFPYFRDGIEVGKTYRAIRNTKRAAGLLCGGCQQITKVTMMLCEDASNGRPFPMAIDAMEEI